MKNCNESEMQIQSILAVENIETLAPEISKKPKLIFLIQTYALWITLGDAMLKQCMVLIVWTDSWTSW